MNGIVSESEVAAECLPCDWCLLEELWVLGEVAKCGLPQRK